MHDTSYKKRVAVLRGGPSSEYEFSMQTGSNVLATLADSNYFAKDIVISKKGEWLVRGFVRPPEQALLDVDVVFIALHGAYGEDGTVQRILERLAIPFTGSSSYASAITLNKVLTKEFLKKHTDTIKMAPHMKVTKEGTANVTRLVNTIMQMFGPEYVIKPVSSGSSVGTKIVIQSELLKEVLASLEENDEIIVEQRIIGKEATVGILEDFRGESYYQLPEVEIVTPDECMFYDITSKRGNDTLQICPGRFSKEEKKMLQRSAMEVHQALGLSQYSRSDFIVAKDGVYFLEINSLPGLAQVSPFVSSLESVGATFPEVITHIISRATI